MIFGIFFLKIIKNNFFDTRIFSKYIFTSKKTFSFLVLIVILLLLKKQASWADSNTRKDKGQIF